MRENWVTRKEHYNSRLQYCSETANLEGSSPHGLSKCENPLVLLPLWLTHYLPFTFLGLYFGFSLLKESLP